MCGDHIKFQKFDFHLLILFMLSLKEDILVVVNYTFHAGMLVPTNALSSFLDCVTKFGEWKSSLKIVES